MTFKSMQRYFHINYEFDPVAVQERIERQALDDAGAAYIVVADGNVLVQVHKDPAYRSAKNAEKTDNPNNDRESAYSHCLQK